MSHVVITIIAVLCPCSISNISKKKKYKIKNVSFVSVNFSANEPYVIHIKYYTKNKYGLCNKNSLR